MNIHFIAIGGSAMHNLAIALHKKGEHITGSDDYFFEPSKSRLKKYGLLPKNEGWDANKITKNIDAIVLGMAAKEDNPELQKALKLNLKIYSYPEYLYEQSKNKKRVVIGGSHGKTSITAMILHVLQAQNIDVDYMVGAQLKGFETMVKISDAPIIILEGDEYLSSALDRRPKFHLYQPNIAVISGIAWDHINVFPTFEKYVEQFRIFIDKISNDGTLIYCSNDHEVRTIVEKSSAAVNKIPYAIPEHTIENGITYIKCQNRKYPLKIFGEHNLMNLNAALNVCEQLGVAVTSFFNSIANFTGASKRLELIGINETTNVYKDFAHSPSKLKATTEAVKTQFTNRKLIACMELHTYSSLNSDFLNQYKDSMNQADEAYVYYNPKIVENKRLAAISIADIENAFGCKKVTVYTDSKSLFSMLKNKNWSNKNLLLMSSGSFDGTNIEAFAKDITA